MNLTKIIQQNMRMKYLFCLSSIWLAAQGSLAFAPNQRRHGGTAKINDFSLFGISEWRDSIFDLPGADRQPLGTEVGPAAKEICILPFPYDEVLLQGQEKQLRLYEDRFIELFDHCMEHHSGVVAMGLIAESGIIQTVPLCEIKAYNRVEGFGIFVTISVVSRATLLEVTQQDPWLKGTCTELTDSIPPNLELPNLVASNIENFMLLLSSMEHRLAEASDKDGEDKEVAELRRKLQTAKLEDRFYDDLGDDEDGEVSELDRKGRFMQAYNVALSTDTQGYCVSSGSKIDRTPQELTAVSWAAFCTNVLPGEDASFRIQALDSEDLFERLKLASHMLREKKLFTRQLMEKAGLKMKGEEDFDEDF